MNVSTINTYGLELNYTFTCTTVNKKRDHVQFVNQDFKRHKNYHHKKKKYCHHISHAVGTMKENEELYLICAYYSRISQSKQPTKHHNYDLSHLYIFSCRN